VLSIKFSAGRQFCAPKSPTSCSRKTLWERLLEQTIKNKKENGNFEPTKNETNEIEQKNSLDG